MDFCCSSYQDMRPDVALAAVQKRQVWHVLLQNLNMRKLSGISNETRKVIKGLATQDAAAMIRLVGTVIVSG